MPELRARGRQVVGKDHPRNRAVGAVARGHVPYQGPHAFARRYVGEVLRRPGKGTAIGLIQRVVRPAVLEEVVRADLAQFLIPVEADGIGEPPGRGFRQGPIEMPCEPQIEVPEPTVASTPFPVPLQVG